MVLSKRFFSTAGTGSSWRRSIMAFSRRRVALAVQRRRAFTLVRRRRSRLFCCVAVCARGAAAPRRAPRVARPARGKRRHTPTLLTSIPAGTAASAASPSLRTRQRSWTALRAVGCAAAVETELHACRLLHTRSRAGRKMLNNVRKRVSVAHAEETPGTDDVLDNRLRAAVAK